MSGTAARQAEARDWLADRETLLLINPDAGGTARLGAASLQRALAASLGDSTENVRAQSGATPALLAACEALPPEPPQLVVACGGDGTLAAVAGALAGSAHVLLPLPGGTANLLCRDLALPLMPVEALRQVLADGVLTRMDVGWVSDGALRRAFLNQVVFGLFSEIAEAREQARTEGVAAAPELLATLLDAVAGETQTYELEIDGIGKTATTNLLVIALNPYDRIEPPWPGRSQLAGGELAVYVGDSGSPLGFAALLARALVEGLDEAGGLSRSLGHSCTVHSASTLNFSVDGEPLSGNGTVRLELAPGALQLLAPQRETRRAG